MKPALRWPTVMAALAAASIPFASMPAFADDDVTDTTETTPTQSAQVATDEGPQSGGDEIELSSTAEEENTQAQSGATEEPQSGGQEGDTGPAATVDINILNINDFHGRIDGALVLPGGAKCESTDQNPVVDPEDCVLDSSPTVDFAYTVETLKAQFPDATAFLSAGDNLNASLFASQIQEEMPTVALLKALGLQASAVGNHEFDRGWTWLADVLIPAFDPTVLLGANVLSTATGEPALDPYTVLEVGGKRVAVIGAVTVETPTLVNPANVAGLRFTDPVDAVNKYAAEIVSGDLADIIVAEYHEGASVPTDLASATSSSAVFSKIVNDTTADVDVILNGHTHQQYAWDAPVPGAEGKTRPVLQTGNYGKNVGQVVLTVDEATNEVVDYSVGNVSTSGASATLAEMCEFSPAMEQSCGIIQDALINAKIVGDVPTAYLAGPITRAYPEGEFVDGLFQTAGEESRAEASSLGTLVGNMLREELADLGEVDFGVANPGGLRTDLVPDADGVITVAQARAVLPFNNELSIATLTGKQIYTLLEQQWQRDANGEVPSRPFLWLGLSDNVSYTYTEIAEPGAPDGQTVGVINSVSINGIPVANDDSQTYTAGTFEFLAAGGDNFWVFQDTEVKDTGFLDWEAWLNYLSDHGTEEAPLQPIFERQGLEVSGDLLDDWKVGEEKTIDVSRVNVFSQGAPANTEINVLSLGATRAQDVVATGVLSGHSGAGSLAFTVPDSLEGAELLALSAQPTGSAAVFPVTVDPADEGTTEPEKPEGEKPGAQKPGGSLAATGASVGLILLLGTAATGTGFAIKRRNK